MRKRRSAANDTEIADGKIWLRSWQPIQLCIFLAAQLYTQLTQSSKPSRLCERLDWI